MPSNAQAKLRALRSCPKRAVGFILWLAGDIIFFYKLNNIKHFINVL